jgi:hypothetical protein
MVPSTFARGRETKGTLFDVGLSMNSGVARRAQGNQIIFCIGARVAAELLVVNFKIGHRAAILTPPAVASQDLLTQRFVRCGVKP